MSATFEQIQQALSRPLIEDLSIPNPAQDGDCLVYAPLITMLLARAGLPAHQVNIVGWFNHDHSIMVFLHHATLCGPYIVDFTATQFNPSLPLAWIDYEADYCRDLAAGAQVHEVEVMKPGMPLQPPKTNSLRSRTTPRS